MEPAPNMIPVTPPWSFRMAAAVCLLALGSLLPAADEAALTGARKFTTPAAVRAQRNFVQGQDGAKQAMLTELEAALKTAMKSGDLEEANAINGTKKILASGGNPPAGTAFKTIGAKAAQAK